MLPVTLELGYWEGEMGGLFFTCRSRVSVRVGGGGVVSYLLLEGHDCVNSDCTLLTRVCDPNGNPPPVTVNTACKEKINQKIL